MTFTYDSARSAAVVLAVCTIGLMSTTGRAETAIPDARRVEETTSGMNDYAAPTKEQKMASCMALWDAETHMTKALWRTVCKRMETEK
jgi:hypothetical protein